MRPYSSCDSGRLAPLLVMDDEDDGWWGWGLWLMRMMVDEDDDDEWWMMRMAEDEDDGWWLMRMMDDEDDGWWGWWMMRRAEDWFGVWLLAVISPMTDQPICIIRGFHTLGWDLLLFVDASASMPSFISLWSSTHTLWWRLWNLVDFLLHWSHYL